MIAYQRLMRTTGPSPRAQLQVRGRIRPHEQNGQQKDVSGIDRISLVSRNIEDNPIPFELTSFCARPFYSKHLDRAGDMRIYLAATWDRSASICFFGKPNTEVEKKSAWRSSCLTFSITKNNKWQSKAYAATRTRVS